MRINGKLSRIICLVLVVAMAVALAFTLTTSAADGITFVAPEGVTVGDGSADSLPEASSYNDYEFVGWSEEKVVDTTNVPTIYAAGTKYTGTVTMLYAVYSYEGEAEGAGFVLKNIAEIQNTDVVVIVSNKSGTRYAMSNSNGTSKAPAAVSVTSDGSKLTGTVDDNVKWNIEKSGDSYIIHPNGSTTTWLYSTNTNNGTRVGNNAAKTWTLDASGYFEHTGTNRYLGVYNGQDWRSYTNTTGNTAGQTFELYVESSGTVVYYTSGDVEACAHANQTTTTVEASCTVDGSITVTCNDCGAVVSTDTIEATGHDYIDGFCTVCGAEEPLEATLVFDADKTGRIEFSTSKQVWVQNGITFTNDKAASTTNVADYANPVRLYANSSITVALGTNKVITKIVFTCNNGTYATALKNSIGDEATVSGSTVTLTPSESADSYTVAKLTAQVRINSLTVYFENTAPACAHNNTTTNTDPATCTENGSITVTCDDCEELLSSEPIIATGHNYVDGQCDVCEWYDGTNVPTGSVDGDSSTIDFSTEEDRLQQDANMQIWAPGNGVVLVNKKTNDSTAVSGDVNPVKLYKNSLVYISAAKEIAKIEFACNTAAYATDLAASIEGATADGKIVTVLLATPVTSYDFTVSEGQVRLDSLTVYYESEVTEPTIKTATVTVGANLAMNYTVALPAGYVIDGMKMVFTMNGVSITVEENGTNVFTYTRLAPQCMGDTITAELYAADGTLVDTLDYSVKAYAEDLLELYASNEYVVALVVDMLNYGAAAQEYRGYKTDALVNAGITAAGSDVAPTDADNKLTATNKGNRNDYADYGITSAGVRFDYINKVYVKFAAPSLENVTVLVNGVAAEVATTNGGYVVYSDAINALEFDEVVTFELQVGGETIQVLTYSVNTYAFNKANSESEVADLALALYRYGKSAAAYAANN